MSTAPLKLSKTERVFWKNERVFRSIFCAEDEDFLKKLTLYCFPILVYRI